MRTYNKAMELWADNKSYNPDVPWTVDHAILTIFLHTDAQDGEKLY